MSEEIKFTIKKKERMMREWRVQTFTRNWDGESWQSVGKNNGSGRPYGYKTQEKALEAVKVLGLHDRYNKIRLKNIKTGEMVEL